MKDHIVRRLATALLATTALGAAWPAAAQQLQFQTFAYPGSLITTVTGIRGNTMTGNFLIAGSNTGGLLFTPSFGNMTAFPQATSNGANYPGATSSTPYGPNWGSSSGILRVVGSYKTTATGAVDLGYLYDGAAAPGLQLTTLFVNGSGVLNTIPHSNFGNQVVGNYDTILATGNAFVYNIATNTYTTINRPTSGGTAASTTAYGIYGNQIVGGSTDVGAGGLTHAYMLNQTTGVYSLYDAPGATAVTHFEGVTGGGRANTYNLVADSLDINGQAHAWAVHVDANGNATWTEISYQGNVTSANSVYGNTVIGVYVAGGITTAYVTTIPGTFYNPITNNGALSSGTAGAVVLSGTQGDDIVNNGSITTTGAGSVGINPNTYGAVTNNGTISASGTGSSAVLMSGTFGTLLNYGTITAAPGSYAIQTDATSVGTVVVNTGTLNGQVSVNAGPYARFENSGWMGISAPGAGVAHQVSGTFAQTSLGTLSLRVAPGGVSDQLQVNGVARLAGTLQAVFQPGTYSRSTYTMLTATSGYTGTFNALSTQNLPVFLNASLGYNPNTVTLSLQSSMASLGGLSGNQLAVANALDGAFNSGSGLNNVSGLYGLNAAQIGQALTVLSGSNASVGQSTSVMAGGQFAALLGNRATTRQAAPAASQASASVSLETCSPDSVSCEPPAPTNWSAWGTGFGGAQWLNAESRSASPAAQQGVLGGAFGGDYQVGPQTLLGVALGLSDSSYSVGSTGASGRATGAHFGLYGLQEWQGFYLNAALSYSRFDGNATRVIAGIGATETAKSTVVSNQFAGRVEVGRGFTVSEEGASSRYVVTPFAALQPVQLWTPGYSETSFAATGGYGVFALSYQAQSTTSLPLSLGAQFDAATQVRERPLSAYARLAWVHEFMPDRNVTAGFTTLPGTSFTVDGAKASYNAARIDLGGRYAVGEQTFLFANGSAELSDRGQSIGGTVGLRFTW
jgi:uncharacterized protein with beta-barrel porin domain